ncbi:YhgE/Pip domain-containing protein [Glaciihabitans sp. dw_435]|uniref:YhgE/Pip family protein n=1 Tax=Glaciihabitans sp. dw_435 TaxID=2720081 RepID=UPI001BD44676|nr:YhgE/Pip domain-containing protein [Glaciihabitans sp. dw_435]
MSQSTDSTPRGKRRRNAALAVVVLVPLAFAGLVVGALSQVKSGVDAIPAAIVNNDKLITTTAADGTKSTILAGRQLVTELTGKDSPGFDWTITNDKDAKKLLADGKVYAILEVPEDFSKSITSLSGDDPQQANITISTDDSHNYLTGAVAQTVGDGLVATFGTAITQQYIAGIYSSIGTVGGSLSDAADGAAKLSDGATSLSSGLDKVTDGVGSAQSGAAKLGDGARSAATGASKLASGAGTAGAGATKFASGVGSYVGGVGSLASGLHTLASSISKIDASTFGLPDYTGGVSAISAQLTRAAATLKANPTDPTAQATVQALSSALAKAASNGPAIVGGVNTTFDKLAAGASKSAAGADTLASSGSSLKSGAKGLASGFTSLQSGASSLASGLTTLGSGGTSLASGLGTLKDGVAKSADGASSLATGAGTLADGLKSGATQVPSFTEAQTKTASTIAASPVGLTVDRNNEVSSIGQIIATLFVPLGLWIGALAIFLVLRPTTRSVLSSTASNGRITRSVVGRASIIAAAQAVLLVALLHISLDVSWALLPATLLFSLVMAVAFTAFHYFLSVWLGRFGLVVSIVLLAIQITATGGLYPIQLLAGPFQVISPFLPLTYGVAGMQAIISGGSVGAVVLPALGLLVFGALSVLVSFAALGRMRRARALGLVPAAA